MRKVLLLFSGMVLFAHLQAICQDASYVGDLPPIELGTWCSSDSPSYTWETVERSRWDIKSAILTPTDFHSPTEWQLEDRFLGRLAEVVGSDPTIDALAQACVEIRLEFLQNNANLFFLLERAITFTKREIVCLDNIWAIESESIFPETEQSEWVSNNSVAYDIGVLDSATLISDMVSSLSEINSQPGSDIRPHHSYTSH